MKKILIAVAALVSIYSNAQPVPKRVVVEHFTNTYCPPCATRNPNLYTNLAVHPSVYHMSYHPSSPYPSCTLYQHNPSENDARTNYYGVYGSTPRIVIQGAAYPANVNFADTALFTSSMGQLTPFDMTVSLTQLNATTLRVVLTIYKEDTSSLNTAEIYGAIAEDTLMFTSNNGEPAHYDVFRKAIWSANPQSTPLPAMVNTSVSMMQDITINNAWDLSKVFAMVMLHNGTDVIQVAKSAGLPLTSGNVPMGSLISIYPNPATELITIVGVEEGTEIEVKDLNGRSVLQQSAAPANEQVDITSLTSGLYILTVSSKGKTQHFKLLKQ